MALYFVDLRDDAEFVVDEEGTELHDMRAMQDASPRSGLAAAGLAS